MNENPWVAVAEALDKAWPYKRVKAPDWFAEKFGAKEMFFTVPKDAEFSDDYWKDSEALIRKAIDEAEPIVLD